MRRQRWMRQIRMIFWTLLMTIVVKTILEPMPRRARREKGKLPMPRVRREIEKLNLNLKMMMKIMMKMMMMMMKIMRRSKGEEEECSG
jgi:hypothetical protein